MKFKLILPVLMGIYGLLVKDVVVMIGHSGYEKERLVVELSRSVIECASYGRFCALDAIYGQREDVDVSGEASSSGSSVRAKSLTLFYASRPCLILAHSVIQQCQEQASLRLLIHTYRWHRRRLEVMALRALGM